MKEYTHFTSPIRRYPDLIVHRALKWALENPDAKARARRMDSASRAWPQRSKSCRSRPSVPIAAWNSQEIASESSESERRADGAERELMEWKTAQFMESHLGEEYEALIISVQKFGFFVELVDVSWKGW